MKNHTPGSAYKLKRTALAVMLGACLAHGGVAMAQSTSGSIRGNAPAGTTITVKNTSGFSRTIAVDADGRYSISSLPVGSYTVDAGGLGSRSVIVTVGNSSDVSFTSGAATNLETVMVVGASAPSIDVTSTSTNTVLTADQIQRLPLVHSAEAIALLAPGTVAGNAYQFSGGNHGSPLSFGGASVAENAYYINGFFSGTPTTNVGGYSLPYGAIEQQETYTGGYSAKYGRSDGGVINQIGKSGSNEVHFGGQITYSPRGLRDDAPDRYLPNETLPDGYNYAVPKNAGILYSRGDRNKSWGSTYAGYVSGPLIKDRLFAFVAGEADKTNARSFPTALGSPVGANTNSDDSKVYAKINWNINDNNFLEYTYLARKYTYEGTYFDYDFDTNTKGEKNGQLVTPEEEHDEYSIIKYTSYITDNLTFNAIYGRSRLSYVSTPATLIAGLPYLSSTSNQNPAYWPAGTPSSGITNDQRDYQGYNARDYTNGLRAELEWVVGNHTLTGGIDNMKLDAANEGSVMGARRWIYSKTSKPALDINKTLGVGAPNSQYYVQDYVYASQTSMSLKQRAFYLEDKWQVTDNVLLSLGIRNDKFTNYNVAGDPYADSGNQWAPRIGASWDVFGDSSLKVFGNAGRYFLALPNNVAVRGANSATFTREYFTYTGIDPSTGAPTGLTPVPGVNGAPAPGPVSSNNEFGQAKDPNSVAASDLKSEYQDEYILGFEKTLGEKWSFGAKLTYRDLKSAIDDVCDYGGYLLTKLQADGGNPNAVEDPTGNCYLFNPGGSNTFKLANVDGSGYTSVHMSSSDWGFHTPMKRTYKAIDLFLEHPFDGKWEARIDYTYSKSEGNMEGPANSDTGQGGSEHDSGISLSQNWDAPEFMDGAMGYLPNDRRHQLKVRGSYAFNDEWSASGNLRIMSGAPISCWGFYDMDGTGETDPVGYGGAYYHSCFGEESKPGKTRTPWTHRVDLGVTYRPAFFDHKLALGLNVFNVFNERHATVIDSTSETTKYTVSNTYGIPLSFATPRYVMLSISMDY